MKVKSFVLAVCGLLACTHAQLEGAGYDGQLEHIKVRLGIADFKLDLGFGMDYDGDRDGDEFRFGLSGVGMFPMGQAGKLSLYGAGGLVFNKMEPDNTLDAFVAAQPEVEIIDNLLLSVRFGLAVPLIPDFKARTFGMGISIVEGLNFLIVF